MDPVKSDLRTNKVMNTVSRRAALRGLGGAGLAALAVGLPGRAVPAATTGSRQHYSPLSARPTRRR